MLKDILFWLVLILSFKWYSYWYTLWVSFEFLKFPWIYRKRRHNSRKHHFIVEKFFILISISIIYQMIPISIHKRHFFHLKKIPGFTRNDVIIPGKVVIFGGTSTQIICIVPRNICAKNCAFSTMCTIFSPFTPTIAAKCRLIFWTSLLLLATNNNNLVATVLGPSCWRVWQNLFNVLA